MAQSRTEPATPSVLMLTQQLNGHLLEVENTFSNAFKTAGHGSLFADFYAMVSPIAFPCDDLQVINTYYLKGQTDWIPTFLESKNQQTLPFNEKMILKGISDLCHSIARIKYSMDKLIKLLPAPESVSASCNELNEQLNLDMPLGRNTDDRVNREVESLECQIQFIYRGLLSLGYLTSDDGVSTQRIDRNALPERLLTLVGKLKSIAELNEIIEPIEAAKHEKRNTSQLGQPLRDEINVIHDVNRQLGVYAENSIQQLAAALERLESRRLQLQQTLLMLERNIYVFQLYNIINELENEVECPGLLTAINNVTRFCDNACSILSTYTKGMVSDPWRDAKNAVTSMTTFNGQLMSLLNSYNSNNINMRALNNKYTLLKDCFLRLCNSSITLRQKLERARLISQDCQQAISHITDLLQEHLEPPKSDGMLNFLGRHWAIITAGGAGGAAAASAVVLLSTNPLVLTAFLASGIAMGAAGGTGGGLLQDVVSERRKSKKPNNVKGYGSLWHEESAAAAAAAEAPPTVAFRK